MSQQRDRFNSYIRIEMEVNAQDTLKLLLEKNTRITELEEEKENLIRADKKKSDHIDELEEEIVKLKRRISDLEELLDQYDPDRNESKEEEVHDRF